VRTAAIRDLFTRASEEVRRHFNVQSDCSFDIDAAWIEVRAGSAS
jgi:hypothetical protein